MQKKKKRVKKKQVKNYPIVDIPPTVLVADPVYYGNQKIQDVPMLLRSAELKDQQINTQQEIISKMSANITTLIEMLKKK